MTENLLTGTYIFTIKHKVNVIEANILLRLLTWKRKQVISTERNKLLFVLISKSDSRLGMSVTTQGGSGRQFVTAPDEIFLNIGFCY